MLELLEAINGLAALLEADTRKKRLSKTLMVSAFATITARGLLRNPVAIAPGDDLYIAMNHQPGAGTISRDTSGRLFAVARQALEAGEHGRIRTGLYEKLWITDGNPCEVCDDNAIAGWIPADEEFPSGDDEPLAHPNCQCELEMRRADEDEED